MKDNERLIAVCSGGDWNDASVGHYVISKDLDLEKEKEKYDKWYNEEYVTSRYGGGVEYISFDEWLIKNAGARETSNDEIEVFWED